MTEPEYNIVTAPYEVWVMRGKTLVCGMITDEEFPVITQELREEFINEAKKVKIYGARSD